MRVLARTTRVFLRHRGVDLRHGEMTPIVDGALTLPTHCGARPLTARSAPMCFIIWPDWSWPLPPLDPPAPPPAPSERPAVMEKEPNPNGESGSSSFSSVCQLDGLEGRG